MAAMRPRLDIHTPFHIDLSWWTSRGRDFDLFLAEILGEPVETAAGEAATGGQLDYIDPETAEVHRLDALWVRVLVECAPKADYIGPSTPLTNALLRALVANLNRPMSAVELQRRINRSSPQTLLSVLKTASAQYGILPADSPAP